METPTLNKALEHMKKNGGYFKGRNGRVEYQTDEYTRCHKCGTRVLESQLDNHIKKYHKEPTAEELLN